MKRPGLTVTPEPLKVAHIIHGAWGMEAPTTSSPSSSPPKSGRATRDREPCKHTQVCWIDANASPAQVVNTTSSVLHRYLMGGPEVSLGGWG